MTVPGVTHSGWWAVGSSHHFRTMALRGKPVIAKGQALFVFGSGKCETRACFLNSYEFYGYSDREKWGWILVPLD